MRHYSVTLFIIFAALSMSESAETTTLKDEARESGAAKKLVADKSPNFSFTPKLLCNPELGEVGMYQPQDLSIFDIVYSLCGSSRKEELLRSIHSLLLLLKATEAPQESRSFLYRIHIITDGSVTIHDLSLDKPSNLCYQLHAPSLKAAPLFAPCSTQRLYLHEHGDFQHIRQVIYIDMDTLWLDTPRKFKFEFNEMNENNASFAMALETTDKNGNASWYKGGHSKDLPYFGQYGLNAGVLLLDLDTLRDSDFTQERTKIIKHFYPRRALPLGDQDVLNAYGFKYPERIRILPCIFNFRSDAACYNGFPAILHGNRNLRNDGNSTYSTLYRFFGIV